MLEKIISGAQTGADMAGLNAAIALGLQTGGFVPKGWKTEDGPKPELADLGLIETPTASYVNRTVANVQHSDGTALFGETNTPGAKVTLRAIDFHRKPSIVNPRSPEEFREWLEKNQIRVLNVAGNRESKRPGIYQRVFDFLLKSLSVVE